MNNASNIVIVVKVHGPQPYVYEGFKTKLEATIWAVEHLNGYDYSIVRTLPALPHLTDNCAATRVAIAELQIQE